jgi:tRNA(fMet)-specific endonuclease VapC
MLRYMLDTNVCIHVMRQRSVTLLGRFVRSAGQLCISSISLAELHYGAEKSGRREQAMQAVNEFVAQLEVLPFLAQAAVHHGQIRAELERLGQPSGPYDMLIGAHARSEGLTVVTNNLREFARMPGVLVEAWV